MKKTNAQTLGRDNMLEQAWFWGNGVFIVVFSMSIIKAAMRLGFNQRFLHILSCLSLMVSYGSCVFFKTPAINIQKLLRDGNFRCFLVFCSFLTMRGSLVPMIPFLLMSCLSLSSYILKNKKLYENSLLMGASQNIASKRDQITVLALKIEVLSVPLLVLHLLTGNADLFAVVSYASMAWFEYTTNPSMKKAVTEIVAKIDKTVESPSVPASIKQRYTEAKKYLTARMPAAVHPMSEKTA
ncbi:hypothetical protein NEDG_00620 [Nematocida displodere]|uniref:Uncharacterized protein n=1 Tax=Nematocida displodere TaxID=1805483 RepID=A0A177EC23_9MICR|nr:hypothetical protein NEDG_00620 [Nematocida displodere]